MAEKKLMMDIDKKTSMTVALSNEHQRNWDDDLLNRKIKSPEHNYDPTRMHLNFEVAKGGKIQIIDKSKNIFDKVNERIADGVTCKGSVRSTSHRSVLIAYGGNRERMRELAFGNQTINEDGDNHHLVRNKNIENWARDTYRFACKEYGEDNIVSFIVHLDELNPHAHCVVVPITSDGHLSCKAMFGGTDIIEVKMRLNDLHTRYAEEVGSKYGLERGDDIHASGAKHVSLEQYHRNLYKDTKELEEQKTELSDEVNDLEVDVATLRGEIYGLESKRDDLNAEIAKKLKAKKSLSTMIINLNSQKEGLEDQLKTLNQELQDGKISIDSYNKRKDTLSKEITLCNEKLADKQQKISVKEQEIASKKQELKGLEEEIAKRNPYGGKFEIPHVKLKIPRITEKPPLFGGGDKWVKEQNEKLDTEIRDLFKSYGKIVMESAQDSIKDERALYIKTMDDNVVLSRSCQELKFEKNNLIDDVNGLLSQIMNREIGKVKEIAMILFAGGEPVYIPCAGGGSSCSHDGWDDRKKDEDDLAFLRRCFFHASKVVRKAGVKRTYSDSRHR